MPRKIDPSVIRIGGGLSSPKSVESSSFVHETQGLDGLVAHVVDPSRAHTAEAVDIVDALGLYASEDVEGALQEIGASVSNFGQSGVISGGTFTSAGLLVTLGATVVRIGTDRDMTGGSVTLTNNATCWLYVTPAGLLTHSTGSSAPSITSPENILLWRIVTSGGSITSSTDARFFVPNVDRKLSYTVRAEGTATDRNSEACFESLDAVLLYLEQFPAVAKKKKVIVRGSHTINSAITVPVDDVVFDGEDGAEFITGSTLSPMIEIGGLSGITFRNLTFTCEDASSVAIAATLPCNNLLIQSCKFESGASDWTTCVEVPSTSSTSDNILVKDCHFSSSGLAFFVARFSGLAITDCAFIGVSGSIGFYLGDSATATSSEGRGTVSRCIVEGYDAAASIEAYGVTISDCSFRTVERGIDITVGGDFTLRDSTLVLGASGTIGISMSAPRCKITNCLIENSRSVWSGIENTFGIAIVGAEDAVVSGTTIKSFLNTFDNSGNGIRIDASSPRCRITDTYVDETSIGIQTSSIKVSIQSFSATEVEVGIQSSGAMTSMMGVNIDLSSSRGLSGVNLVTGDNQSLTDVTVTTSRLTSSYASDTPTGVEISSSRVSIKGLIVENLYSTTSSSYGIEASAVGATFLSVTGGSISDAGIGILTGGASANLQGIQFDSVGVAIQSSGSGAVIHGCSGSLNATYGTNALQLSGTAARITSCIFTLARTLGWSGQDPYGCSITGSNILISSCRFDGFYNNIDNLGSGITVGSSSTDVQISDVRINNTKTGLAIGANGSDIQAQGINIEAVETGISILSSKVQVSNCSIVLDSVRGDRGIYVSGTLTNINLSGCRIDCSQVGLYGIYFLSLTEISKILISGCDVSGMTTTGIFLLGQCRNADVRGCNVDGYLTADPYDPTGDGIRIRFNGSAFPKDVSVQDCSVTRCTDGISVIGTVQYPVLGVSISGNRVSYCGWSSTLPDRTTFAATGSKGIGLDHCMRILISSNILDKIGCQINSLGVEGFPTSGGPDVASNPIYLRNCTIAAVSDNVITNSLSDGSAFSFGINVDQLSSGSASPFETKGFSIARNNLQWDSGLSGNGLGFFAIQVYIDDGTDAVAQTITDLILAGNIIGNVQGYGISAILGSQASVSSLRASENKFASGAFGLYFILSTTTSTLTNVDITSNLVMNSTINSIQFDTTNGSVIQGVRVSGNTFVTCTDEMLLFDIASGSTCYDVVIDGNHFGSGNNYAVRFDGGSPTSYGRFKILNNTVLGRNGFSVECFDYDLDGVEITGNNLRDGIVTNLLNISVTSTTDVEVSNIQVCGNTSESQDGGIQIVVDGTIDGFDVSSNHIQLDAGSASYSLDVTTQPGTVLGAQRYNQDWTIDDNTMSGGSGVRLTSSTGPSFKNISISKNIIRNASPNAINVSISSPVISSLPIITKFLVDDNVLDGQEGASDAAGIYLLLGGATSVASATADSISVSRNTMTHWGSTGVQQAIWVQVNAVVSGLSIDQNKISNCGSGNTVTAGTGGFIDLGLGQPTSTVASRNISISGNALSNNNGGKGIYVHEMSSAGASRIRGLTICNNDIFGVVASGTTTHHGDGICVDLTGFTNDTNSVVPGDIHIDHNTVTRIGNGTVVYSDAGIVFTGPANLTVECCSVDKNSVSQTGSGSTGSVLIEVHDANDLSVSSNKVVGSTSTTAGIYVVVDGVGSSVKVDDNSVQSSSGDGVRIDTTGVDAAASGFYALSVDGNLVITSAGNGIYLVGNATTSGPLIQASSISNNKIHEVGGCGIEIVTAASVILTGIAVDQNEIYDSTDTGIRSLCGGLSVAVSGMSISSNKIAVSGASGIEFGSDNSSSTFQNIDVSGNLISEMQHHGIWLKGNALSAPANPIFGMSVCGNTVYDWSKVAGTNMYAGIKLEFGGASHVSVANNSLRNDNTYAYGFWLFILNQIRCFNITGNSSHLGDEIVTQSLLFSTAASSDQASMTITGNAFRAAATGVVAAGSFAPDRSILVGNTDRTTGGAGALAAFGALFLNSQVSNNQN